MIKNLIYKRKKIYVFCFHSISDKPSQFCIDNNLNLQISSFKLILNRILKNFDVVSPKHENFFSSGKNSKPKAIITFDDGFQDSFDNGISYLLENKIPVLMFLNMKNVIHSNVPLIPAIYNYLSKENLLNKYNINDNYLKSNPNSININIFCNKIISEILNYQGDLVKPFNLKKYLSDINFFVGNHFYEHWNGLALSNNQIVRNYRLNDEFLKLYKNYIGDFAFTNGVVRSCWNFSQLKLIQSLGAKRIYSANGGLYNDDILQDRIAISETDVNENNFKFKIFKSHYRDLILSGYLKINKFKSKYYD